MVNMYLSYEKLDDELYAILRVDRRISNRWQKPEIEARTLLSNILEKIDIQDSDRLLESGGELLAEVHHLGMFKRGDKRISDNLNMPYALRLIELREEFISHYHFYKGSNKKLREIAKHCFEQDIPFKEGIDEKLKDRLPVKKEEALIN